MCPKLVQDAFLGQALKEWMPVEPKGPISEGYVTVGEPKIYRIPKEQLIGTTTVTVNVRNTFFYCIYLVAEKRQYCSSNFE